ncbi:opioid growth factor receptor-like [Hippoglossus hippoglossus]|uniref:opioid growth factor receptor-like n=1 Tax=Hippoglossus hippoglossus TaxID=8267 RepID=UPI00148DEBD0|nr:opioid growth factor receptor-like [Hippoglossus hippoglossus]
MKVKRTSTSDARRGSGRFRRRIRVTMSWLVRDTLCPVVAWLWRRTLFIRRLFAPITRYLRLETGWTGERRGGDEPQLPSQQADLLCEAGLQERPEECQGSEGQREAKLRVPGEDREQEEEQEEQQEEQEEQEDEECDSEQYRVDNTDELYCGYDSTWETEQTEERPAASSQIRMQHWNQGMSSYKFSRFENAARDMHNYRHDYPSQIRMQGWNQNMASDDNPNLEFYLGNKPSLPDGIYIQDFHSEWFGNYNKLEYVHTYIQWLFPLQEPGMNHDASILTREEIEDFLRNDTAKENLLKSYELMLDFYGIELCDKNTGQVRRASNWKDRFCNLNNRTHNNLRITRILKCLGTLGFRHYQAPLVHFFLKETLVHGQLPDVKDSVLNYFVFAVLDKNQRRSLIKFAYLNYDRKDEFVWCPRKIQMMLSEWSASKSQEGVEGENDVKMLTA